MTSEKQTLATSYKTSAKNPSAASSLQMTKRLLTFVLKSEADIEENDAGQVPFKPAKEQLN